MDNKYIFIISLIILIIAIIAGVQFTQSENPNTIKVYAGVELSPLCNDLIKEFNKKHPEIEVDVRYDSNNGLFTMLETQKKGDVFISTNYKTMENAMINDYIDNSTVRNLTQNIPVIVVQKENPKNISSVDDLARGDINVGVVQSESSSMGKTSQEILNKTNFTYDSVITTTTVKQLLNYLNDSEIDATIVWDSVIKSENNDYEFKVIEIPENQTKVTTIPAGVTKFTDNNESANTFVKFVSNNKNAHAVFEKWGYESL